MVGRGAVGSRWWRLSSRGAAARTRADSPPKLNGTVTIGVLAPTDARASSGSAARICERRAAWRSTRSTPWAGCSATGSQLELVDDGATPRLPTRPRRRSLTTAKHRRRGRRDLRRGGRARGVAIDSDRRAVHGHRRRPRDDLVTTDMMSAFLHERHRLPAGALERVLDELPPAQRLAIVQDDSRRLQAAGAQGDRPDRRGAEARLAADGRAGQTGDRRIAKAAIAAKPNYVLWTGAPEAGGELVKALHSNGYTGIFGASAASESPAFLQRGR